METQKLAEHRIFSFITYPMKFAQRPDRRLSDLVRNADGPNSETLDFERPRAAPVAAWLPERLLPAVERRYGDEPVFEPAKVSDPTDLYAPVRRLLNGELSERCRIYDLSERARDLLRRGRLYDRDVHRDQQAGHQLMLLLSPAAASRLQAGYAEGETLPAKVLADRGPKAKPRVLLPIQIDNIRIYHFATHQLVCQVAIQYKPVEELLMTPALLAEMLQHCGRFSTLAWKEVRPKIDQEPDTAETNVIEGNVIAFEGFTIGALVARLLFGGRGISQLGARTYTHAYAQVAPDGPETSPDRLRPLGRKFARRYSSDYKLSETASGFGYLSDFDNVQHVVAREGAATIVDQRNDGKIVPFLKDYLTNAVEPSYLPIIVLNLHQLAQGLELSARSVLTTSDSEELSTDSESVVADWSFLEKQLTVLNARFRFRQISQISMHNAYHRALREAFDLDGLEAELAADLSQMAARVQAEAALRSNRQRELFRRSYRWIPIFATGAVSGIVFLEFANTAHAFAENGFSHLEIATGIVTLALILIGIAWAIIKTDQDPD